MGYILIVLLEVLVKSIPGILTYCMGYLMNRIDKKRDYVPVFTAAAFMVSMLK